MICWRQLTRKYLERIAGLLLGLMIFTTISLMLNEMYVDVEGIAWYRILWHNFYEDEGKIDDLYLGSSHVYYDIDPLLLNQLSGRYHFNLASPAQALNGSFYLLREADRRNELQHVYLEMFYLVSIDDDELLDYQRNWNNTDYIKASVNKAEYMAAIGGVDQYVNILLPFSRYRANLGDWEYVKKQLKEKRQEDYLTYHRKIEHEDGNGRASVERQGYLKSTRVFQDSKRIYPQNAILSRNPMDEKNKNYCRKIIEYCQERGIPITLFVSPVNDLQLLSVLHYDYYVAELQELAAEYGIRFYDFNLAKEEYLPLQFGAYYRDTGHLNSEGGKLFTPFLNKVFEKGDYGDFFYDSYQEKLQNSSPAIYGIYYSYMTEEEGKRTMWIASNRDSEMEYRVVLSPIEGTRYVVQDFSENKEFSVSSEEHGVCRIIARMKDSPETIVQNLEIEY